MFVYLRNLIIRLEGGRVCRVKLDPGSIIVYFIIPHHLLEKSPFLPHRADHS
jgi:hypothetical protein